MQDQIGEEKLLAALVKAGQGLPVQANLESAQQLNGERWHKARTGS